MALSYFDQLMPTITVVPNPKLTLLDFIHDLGFPKEALFSQRALIFRSQAEILVLMEFWVSEVG